MVVFLTFDKLPDGDAGSIRYIHLSYLINECGYETILVGFGDTPYKQVVHDVHGAYVSLRKRRFNRLGKAIDHLFKEKTLIDYAIKNYSNASHFIIGSAITQGGVKRLKDFSKSSGIKIIYSIMEWYSTNILPTKFSIVAYLGSKRNQLFMKKMKPEFGSVISISSHLHNYFTNKGIKSVRIPFVLEANRMIKPETILHEKLSFIYAGRPGNKDNYQMIIKAFSLLEANELNKIELYLIGISIEDIKKSEIGHLISKCPQMFNQIHAIKNIEHEEVALYYLKSDFSVLLRPPYERYAKAGFPTKVVESLFLGVPVISNLTSDLHMYLSEGINSLIVCDYSAESMCETIRKALVLSSSEIVDMKRSAYITAIERLHIGCYKNEIIEILNS